MKPTSITLGLKRDVRLAKYQVSQCSATLTMEVEEGDDVDYIINMTHEELVRIVSAMIEEEKRNHKEQALHEIKNQ